MSPRLRRWAGLGGQTILIGAGAWFLVATTRAHWPTLNRLDLAPSPVPLIAASLLTAGTYGYLVALWVRSLRWWTPPQRLPYREGLRIWFLTNLARFIPGTVWQFAGLAALARGQGVSPVAATGAILLQQVGLLASGVAVGIALAPGLAGAWGAALSPGAIWGLVAGLALVAILLLPATGRLIRRSVATVAGRDVTWPEPPPKALAVYVLALALPWLAYGVAFWCFGRALLGAGAPGPVLAAGAFTASYVAGIVAVIAPGGIVVREAALVAALAPAVGADHALLLALGSRVWLVAVEVVTALLVLAWHALTRSPATR